MAEIIQGNAQPGKSGKGTNATANQPFWWGNSALVRLVLISTSGLALAACAPARFTPTADNAKSVYATGASDTANAALNRGDTLAARPQTAKTLNFNWDTRTTALGEGTVELKKNAAGGYDLTVNGQSYSFATADLTADGSGFQKRAARSDVGLYTWSHDNVTEAQTSTRYSQVWQVWDDHDFDDNAGQGTFFVTGTETMPQALRDLPVASYQGWAVIRFHLGENVPGGSPNNRIRGDIALVADFGAGTVSGTIGDLESRQGAGAWTPLTGSSITLNSANISGNGYSGTMTPVGPAFTGPGTAEAGYSGAFFGPAAQETAGVLWALIRMPDGSIDSNGVGVFQADKQ